LVGLTPEQRAEHLPSGQGRANNRIGWAVSYLNRVGAIDRPTRGHYRLAAKGVDLLAQHPKMITEGDLRAIANPEDTWWSGKAINSSKEGHIGKVDEEGLDPIEQIEAGLKRIHEAVAADLLARLQDKDPAFF